jgi:hypothetical protein
MSWSQIDFKGKNGVQTLLKRLAASPLVRKNLPTPVPFSTSTSYKRYPQESIANFLVRESLYYEEFVESLLALKDEQQGGTMKDVFDFSDSSSSSDEDGKDDDDDDKKSRKSKASEGKTSDAKGSYKRVPTEEPSQHRGPRGGDSVPGDSPHGSRPFSRRAPPSLAGLGSFDSFILKQLRGWRLLSGACLSAEEWRAVLASTNNKLDYESVSVALTILYDDQIQFQRGGHHHQALQRGPQLFSLAEDEDWYGESSWWDDWDSWANYAGWHDDDEEWPADEPGADPEPSDDTKKENDAMAQQTWAQAHKSTQLAKKDRGFGKAAGKGSSDGCHICGHPGHYARDCPDRQAPKGKGRMYHMGYYEDDSLYAFQKGKGKSKGKYGKNMHLMDELFYMRGKGFGNNMKGKGKGKTKNTGVVNAYYADYEEPYGYHVLDFKEEVLDLQAAATETPPRAAEISLASLDNKSSAGPCGMLDSGATCSAGPESSIKNLVSALLKQDKSAKIHIDGKRCPRFRYGSGKWGKALFRISMESSLSSHTFHAYALPDPEESKEPWFNDSMLVPVLIGMDFIDSHGLIIDFSEGMAVCGNHPEGKPFYLPRNSKKHLMVDVVQFLTEGNICSQGSPTINVVMGDGIDEQLSAELFTLSIDSLCWNQYWPLILENDETGSNDQQSFECQMTSTCPTPSPWFEKLWNRRLDLNRKSGSMGSSTSKAHETSTSSSLLDPMAPKQTKEEKELYLDFERTVTADLRDPRAKSHQWPCMGNHNKAKPQSNKWGQWTNCAVCGLRMEYIPKKGAPASETHQPNPAMVLRALKELQQLLPGGALPEEALVRVVIDKVVAEERMTTLLEEYQRQLETAKKKVIKGQQAMMTAGRGQPSSGVPSGYHPEMPTSPPRSTTSWEQVTSQQSPPRRPADEIMELLTQEERNQLMQRVQHRAAQDTAVPVSEAEMEPDFNQNLALN